VAPARDEPRRAESLMMMRRWLRDLLLWFAVGLLAVLFTRFVWVLFQ
jgi:hypothetical protein